MYRSVSRTNKSLNVAGVLGARLKHWHGKRSPRDRWPSIMVQGKSGDGGSVMKNSVQKASSEHRLSEAHA